MVRYVARNVKEWLKDSLKLSKTPTIGAEVMILERVKVSSAVKGCRD